MGVGIDIVTFNVYNVFRLSAWKLVEPNFIFYSTSCKRNRFDENRSVLNSIQGPV